MTGFGSVFKAGRFQLPLGQKTYTVGILNVTPDSFSDGGRFNTLSSALEQAEKLVQAGADLLDIGGESTRPGSLPIPAAEEIARIVPVIEFLAKSLQVPLSVDTFKADVADAALSAGASIVNDVTGLFGGPAMAGVVARHQAGVIVMHNAVLYRKDHPSAQAFTNMPWLDAATAARFCDLDLLAATRLFWERSLEKALAAGISSDSIILDPGVGFGLSTDESLDLLAALDQIQTGVPKRMPILVGPSRKRFIGDLLDKPVTERLIGTVAAVAASIARGADFVRVHDVAETVQTVRVCDAILRR